MGFADYLSKNPLEEPLPPSDKDENVVINTIEDFKLALLRNNLASCGAIISSEPNAYKQCNGVLNAKHAYTKKQTLSADYACFSVTL